MNKYQSFICMFGPLAGNWSEWVAYVRGLARELNIPLTHGGITKATGRSPKGVTPYSPAQVDRLASSGNLTSLEISALPPDFRTAVYDWTLTAERVLEGSRPGVLFLGVDAELISPNRLLEVAREVICFGCGPYGFGGRMRSEDGPAMDVRGIGTYGPVHPAIDRWLERWSHDLARERRFEQGYFRQVYPINIISEAHLSRQFRDREVRAAIETGTLPGNLSRLDETRWLWEVHPDDTFETSIEFEQAGLLV